jgi:Fur family zinc uptake transcriptional regulator/Fur family ferric uptake transcriptional regulator
VSGVQDFEGLLRGLKLKVTPGRRAILEVMAAESTFLSPEEIWKRVGEAGRNVGLPTVYRILDELAGGGVVSRVLHDNRQLYYYLCANKNHHHHFVCLSCHKVEDIGLCLGEALEQEVALRIKGALFSHILQLQGLCCECREEGRKG